jgi:hypothetical protein
MSLGAAGQARHRLGQYLDPRHNCRVLGAARRFPECLAGAGGSGRFAIQRNRRKARSLSSRLPNKAVPCTALIGQIGLLWLAVLQEISGLSEVSETRRTDKVLTLVRGVRHSRRSPRTRPRHGQDTEDPGLQPGSLRRRLIFLLGKPHACGRRRIGPGKFGKFGTVRLTEVDVAAGELSAAETGGAAGELGEAEADGAAGELGAKVDGASHGLTRTARRTPASERHAATVAGQVFSRSRHPRTR